MKNLIVVTALLLLQPVLYSQCLPAHTINFSGVVYSKQYVKAHLPGNRIIDVPVINGYLPVIDQRIVNGYIVFDYSYADRILYTGSMPVYSSKLPQPAVSETRSIRPPVVTESRSFNKPPAPSPEPTKQDEFEAIQKTIDEIQETLRKMEKNIQAASKSLDPPKTEPVKPQELPKTEPVKPQESVPNGMRRPSEMGEPHQKIIPRY